MTVVTRNVGRILEGTGSAKEQLQRKILNEVNAKQKLKDAVLREKCSMDVHEEIIMPSQSDSSQSSDGETPAPKKRKSMFDLVEEVAGSGATSQEAEPDEVEAYISLRLLARTESPLKFWKANEDRFPTLARLAKLVLGLPASSGNCERLFSVAGAVARARRARISPCNLEKLLCVRQYLRNLYSQRT